MIKTFIAASFIVAASFSVTPAKADVYTEFKLENLRESLTFAQCRTRLRRAGQLKLGRTGRPLINANFHIINSCVMNSRI